MRAKITLITLFVFFSICGIASAFTWEDIGGARVLKNGSGEVVEHYTAPEWEAWRHQLEGTRECLSSPSSSCDKVLEKGETGMKSVDSYAAENASDVTKAARGDGVGLAEDVAAPLDTMSEAGGTLALGLAGTAIGVVALGPAAFKLGVAIGNELDQLFGLEKWEEKEENKNVEESSEKHAHITHLGPFTVKERENEEETGKTINMPEGYYVSWYSTTVAEYKTDFQGTYSCEDHTATEGGLVALGGAQERTVKILHEGGYSESCKEPIKRYATNVYEWTEPECNIQTEAWLAEAAGLNCKPLGVPNVGTLTPSQEKENTEHGVPAHPEVPAVKPNEVGKAKPMKDETIERITELAPARTYITTHSPHTVKEVKEHEHESGELEIPEPQPNELATEYAKQVEELGFEHVTLKVVTETAINPYVGPNEVARVSPSPGTKASPSTSVEVDANPADSPAPSEPPGGIGGPTLPGIKLPNFPVLCKGFPFGVPCWLIQTIEGWSAAGSAPELGIENFEVEKHTISGAKFKLSHLEPIMEKVRPAMLIFATIGLVLLFYRFAKGGGPPSGSSDDSSGSSDDGES